MATEEGRIGGTVQVGEALGDYAEGVCERMIGMAVEEWEEQAARKRRQAFKSGVLEEGMLATARQRDVLSHRFDIPHHWWQPVEISRQKATLHMRGWDAIKEKMTQDDLDLLKNVYAWKLTMGKDMKR